MADVKYDPAKHSELIDAMNSVKESFEEVITEFKSVKSIVSSDFKGNGATALQTALQTKIEQLTKEKESWSTVIANAGQVEKAFVETDRNAKRIVQGQEPYQQGKGGKIY
ncbi:hypothetical protein DOK67_0000941 [Enterococcus sp. DIV0212c]|uniref:hypothetical protein n=1 Tax=Enterococcus sp. DIV0212c TaxID=2230867 RepID=UPI001A9B0DE5|nr:hypothetical protein [Enterococcus sp. DIV0212c]MBO1352640.1 hypothetical protein [Enterococcus sp. DIV0212c]